jgi:hypothetical protein
MSQELDKDRDPEMLKEYDFSAAVRGKYVGHFAKGSNVVVLDPDVARVFTDSESANQAQARVILPIKVYKELLERAEDAEDVAWLKRAGRKKLHYRPLEDYLAEGRRK